MHMAKMILEHLVVCKLVDFTLHQLYMVVKRALDMAVAMFLLWLFAPILKEADRICRGFGFVLLLIAAGVFSAANLRPVTEQRI